VAAEDVPPPRTAPAEPAPAGAPPQPAAPAQPSQTVPQKPAAPPPPPAAIEELLAPAKRFATVIEDLEKTVERVKDREDALARLRTEIEQVPREAEQAIEALRPRLADAEAQLKRLGPAPKDGEGAETAEIAAERARLSALSAQIDGGIKSAELSIERARQLITRIQELRQQLFTQRLFERSEKAPLRPSVWKHVASSLPDAAARLATISVNWWARASLQIPALIAVVAAAFVVYFGLRAARRRLLRVRYASYEGTQPGYFARAATAGLVAALLTIPGALAVVTLFAGIDSLDLLYLQTRDVAESVVLATLIFIAVSSLARAILQPGRPRWRLIDLSDHAAARLNLITRAIAATYAIDLVANQVVRSLYLPFEVAVATAFLTSLVFAGLLLAIVYTPFTPATQPAGLSVVRWRPYLLKLPLFVVALAIAGTTLSGYIALGRFLAGQVVLTGSALVLVILLHLAIRAVASEGAGTTNDVGAMIQDRLGLDEAQRRQVARPLALVLDTLLILLAVPLLLATLGFSGVDILAVMKAAIFGFEIGQFKISLAQILFALGLFVGLLLLTRLLQRWLATSILVAPRVDAGLANSIHTGVGYVGFAVAALAAVSAGGLDITNLAIVAGALSVGIGFGLQSIVNNFVSGLILLVERPIKVGDWIRVGGNEGHVRRISVRSTEIETFDRASVILPNSELVTGTVTNMTHRNALGRVVIKVGVSYNADPERVLAALESVADQSTAILRHPAPIVAFENFGDSALEFSLRVYLADVNRSIAVQTELRTAIAKAFKRDGIEIPFPQMDVHLRDLDGLKSAFANFMAERARQEAEKAAAGGGAGFQAGAGSTLKPSNDDV